MKAVIATACALLCASSLAAAQSHDRHHDRGHDRGHDNQHRGYNDHSHHGRYHAEHRYQRPHGWRSHHWGHGERLPPAYRVDRYYINDYGRYDLRPPPRGYRWVRVDNDIVLVAITTGLITEALQDFFY